MESQRAHYIVLYGDVVREGWTCLEGRVGCRHGVRRRASSRVAAERSAHRCQQRKKGTYVVGSVRVIVYTAEERGRRVLTDVLDDQVATARVLVDKVRNVVDEASDDDEGPLAALFLDCWNGQLYTT